MKCYEELCTIATGRRCKPADIDDDGKEFKRHADELWLEQGGKE